jgi:hypothetical protein
LEIPAAICGRAPALCHPWRAGTAPSMALEMMRVLPVRITVKLIAPWSLSGISAVPVE